MQIPENFYRKTVDAMFMITAYYHWTVEHKK